MVMDSRVNNIEASQSNLYLQYSFTWTRTCPVRNAVVIANSKNITLIFEKLKKTQIKFHCVYESNMNQNSFAPPFSTCTSESYKINFPSLFFFRQTDTVPI